MKGQTAMEYLMTYGWAIIIVIIVAAALYALGIFNPTGLTGATASGFNQIGKPSPGGWRLDSTGGLDQFELALKNNVGANIVLQSGTVTIDDTVTCTNVDFSSGASLDQATLTVSPGTSFTVEANCNTSSFTAGNSYEADITLTYNVTG